MKLLYKYIERYIFYFIASIKENFLVSLQIALYLNVEADRDAIYANAEWH